MALAAGLVSVEASPIPDPTPPLVGEIESRNSKLGSDKLSASDNFWPNYHQNPISSKLSGFRFADRKTEALDLLPHLHYKFPLPVSPARAGYATRQSPARVDEKRLNCSDHFESSTEEIFRQEHQILSNRGEIEDLETTPLALSSPSGFTSVSRLKQHSLQSSTPRDRALISQFPAGIKGTAAPKGVSRRVALPRLASFPHSIALEKSLTGELGNPLLCGLSGAVVTPDPLDAVVTSTEEPQLKENATKEWAQNQRKVTPPKRHDLSKTNDKRHSRPPLSFRQPIVASAAGACAITSPARLFGSSGSRKSLVQDMHSRRVPEASICGEDATDPNQRDRSRHAHEGRSDDDEDDNYSFVTPPDTTEPMPDDENTADIFMNIARDDPGPSPGNVCHSSESRLARRSYGRPSSTAIPSYQPLPPPQITRQVSDQREGTRMCRTAANETARFLTKELANRAAAKDEPGPSSIGTEDAGRCKSSIRSSTRTGPLTPRSIKFQDASMHVHAAHSRRRSSTTENNSAFGQRGSQHRNSNLSHVHGRSFPSSPLVPRSGDSYRQDGQPASESFTAAEGTESSPSTAAPSTVWDELDDLKSRIHRLELTGKPPSSSGAAMARAAEERDRPPTAITNATTMSASPKRASGHNATPTEMGSIASSPRESQPILMSVLSKTKPVVSSDVFEAIKSAATDAVALLSMFGVAGQPGPISSGASSIGNSGTITDRQLRRKADSICRSLTELCLALADDGPTLRAAPGSSSAPNSASLLAASPSTQPASAPAQSDASASVQKEVPTNPTQKQVSFAASRRKSLMSSEQNGAREESSPRAPTQLEHRRMTMLHPTSVASSRLAMLPSSLGEAVRAGRKSSLVIARARRAVTEDPEDSAGRRSSMLLRTRRAGTEDLEDGRETRKSSLLSRRESCETSHQDEEKARFQAPARAITDTNGLRAPRDHAPTPSQTLSPDVSSLVSPTLPRRRFLAPSSLSCRLTTPAPTILGSRLLDRPNPERDMNSVADKPADERRLRHLSLSGSRTTNTKRQSRDSTIPSLSSSLTSSQSASCRR